MSERRLSDEELSAEIERLEESRHRPMKLDNADALATLRELHALRQLLATPMPCDRQVEHLKVTTDPDGWLNVPGIGCWRPDIMIAFAAQIIRAALAAKGGK